MSQTAIHWTPEEISELCENVARGNQTVFAGMLGGWHAVSIGNWIRGTQSPSPRAIRDLDRVRAEYERTLTPRRRRGVAGP